MLKEMTAPRDENGSQRDSQMMLEDDATVMVCLRPDFPADDLEEIVRKLEASNALVPGFIPASAGFLNLQSITYATLVERAQTVVMPDRNLVSRMASITRTGLPRPSQLAAQIMALCQTVDFNIDPSVAFHELAHRQGNDAALEELAWFRVADENRHRMWIDVALGRVERLPALSAETEPFADLAAPLDRWLRNYVVALKIGALELSSSNRRAKTQALFEWMVSDFIIAGPAAMFASMYLSPRAAKARMMKQLRSQDREKALAGIRNAAWDLTYLSEFVRKVKSSDYNVQRYVLATGDRTMAELAGLLFPDAETNEGFRQVLGSELVRWWGKDANYVANLICDAIEVGEAREPPTSRSKDYVGDMIALGESEIRNAQKGSAGR